MSAPRFHLQSLANDETGFGFSRAVNAATPTNSTNNAAIIRPLCCSLKNVAGNSASGTNAAPKRAPKIHVVATALDEGARVNRGDARRAQRHDEHAQRHQQLQRMRHAPLVKSQRQNSSHAVGVAAVCGLNAPDFHCVTFSVCATKCAPAAVFTFAVAALNFCSAACIAGWSCCVLAAA